MRFIGLLAVVLTTSPGAAATELGTDACGDGIACHQCQSAPCATGACHHGCPSDLCGNVDGYPGHCGPRGPGCCGSVWDNYCLEKTCATARSPRRRLSGLSIPIVLPCLPKIGSSCCDRPLQKPCFTTPALSFHQLRAKLGGGCDAVCDDCCDDCDACDRQLTHATRPPVDVPSNAIQPAPVAPQQGPEAVPPENPSPSAKRGFFPFSRRSLPGPKGHGFPISSAHRKGQFPF